MAEIIEFGKKAHDLKSVRDADLKQKKLEALRKIFQCTRCMMKCAKCGLQIESDSEEPLKYATPYTFCRTCREEYEEYRTRIEGKLTTPRYYWHNDVWMQTWQSWLDHQKSLELYRLSKEFLQLVEEAEELLNKQ
jgi:hypothetical protein